MTEQEPPESLRQLKEALETAATIGIVTTLKLSGAETIKVGEVDCVAFLPATGYKLDGEDSPINVTGPVECGHPDMHPPAFCKICDPSTGVLIPGAICNLQVKKGERGARALRSRIRQHSNKHRSDEIPF